MVWSQKGGRLSGRGLSDRLNTYDDDPDTCRRRRRRRGRVAQNVWPLHTMALGGEGYAIRAASFSCVGYLWILPPYCIDGVALDDVSQSRQYTIGGGEVGETFRVGQCEKMSTIDSHLSSYNIRLYKHNINDVLFAHFNFTLGLLNLTWNESMMAKCKVIIKIGIVFSFFFGNAFSFRIRTLIEPGVMA